MLDELLERRRRLATSVPTPARPTLRKRPRVHSARSPRPATAARTCRSSGRRPRASRPSRRGRRGRSRRCGRGSRPGPAAERSTARGDDEADHRTEPSLASANSKRMARGESSTLRISCAAADDGQTSATGLAAIHSDLRRGETEQRAGMRPVRGDRERRGPGQGGQVPRHQVLVHPRVAAGSGPAGREMPCSEHHPRRPAPARKSGSGSPPAAFGQRAGARTPRARHGRAQGQQAERHERHDMSTTATDVAGVAGRDHCQPIASCAQSPIADDQEGAGRGETNEASSPGRDAPARPCTSPPRPSRAASPFRATSSGPRPRQRPLGDVGGEQLENSSP